MTAEFDISRCMQRNPAVLVDTMEIAEAIDIFVTADISGAPVVDKSGELLGFLSESDCLASYVSCVYNEHAGCGSVADFMTREIDALPSTTDLLTAARMFNEKRRRKFAVVDKGKLVGVLSRHHLLTGIQRIGFNFNAA